MARKRDKPRRYKIVDGKAIGVQERDKKAAAKAMKKHFSKKSKKARRDKPSKAMKEAQAKIQARGDKAYAAAQAQEKANKVKAATIKKQTPFRAPTQPAGPTSQFTPPPEKGFSNVMQVYNAALNPWSQSSVISTTDNKVFNTAAEYIANNPLISTVMLAGVGGLAKAAGTVAKGASGKFTIGQTIQSTLTKAPAFAVNTKTAKQSASLIAGIAAKMKKPAYVVTAVGAMIGTYPWAEWALGEAKEGMIFNAKKAADTEDAELIKEYQQTSDEIFDQELWELFARLTPGINIAYGFTKKAQALSAQVKVNNRILQDKIIQIETGESDDDKWERIRQEKADQEKAATDYYNTERKKMFDYEQEARAAARAATRADEIKARNADAAFWAKEKEKQREYEAADRKAIADFWAAYKKTQAKLSEDSRPSNLNFGLL